MLILNGDARAIPLGDGSVNCVVTSPPYWGLRDYGVAGQLGLEGSPEAYVAALVGVFREVWRVLRTDGVVFLNLGDCYATGAGKANSPGGGKQGDRFLEAWGNGEEKTPHPNPLPGAGRGDRRRRFRAWGRGKGLKGRKGRKGRSGRGAVGFVW